MTCLQKTFQEGFLAAENASNPYLVTSVCWDGFELGAYFRRTGQAYDAIRKSRGDTYTTARGGLYRLHYQPFRIEEVMGESHAGLL